MTSDECKKELDQLSERIADLENEREAIKALPDSVARLAGQVEGLYRIVLQGFDAKKKYIEVEDGNGDTKKIKKSDSFKNAVQVSAVILVPLAIALIAAFATIQAAKGH
jgi:hypothetical protein